MKLSTGAAICLVMDILAFLISSCIIITTTNIVLILIFGLLNFVLSWDAYEATMFLIKNYKYTKRHQ